jgi:hypothetical protein
MTWTLLSAAIALVAVAGLLLSWTAGRMDRLHTRVEAARAALDAQLFHRSAVALEVAATDLLDPATALVLLDAAHGARAVPPQEQESAESDLTQALAAIFDDPAQIRHLCVQPEDAALLEELATGCRKVELARRFYNDAVASALSLRHRRAVRWFGLAGRAEPPSTVEMDDVPPAGFAH